MSGHSKWHQCGAPKFVRRRRCRMFQSVPKALACVLYPKKSAGVDEYTYRVMKKIRCPNCYNDLNINVIRLRRGLYQCRNCNKIYLIGKSRRNNA